MPARRLDTLVPGCVALVATVLSIVPLRGPDASIAAFSMFGAITAIAPSALLALASILTALAGPPTSLVVLIATCSLLWLLPIGTGWEQLPGPMRVIASAATPLLAAAAFHLAKLRSTGRVRLRGLVIGGWVAIGLLASARGAFRDALLDPDCWNDCSASRGLVPWDLGSRVATTGLLVIIVAMAIAAVTDTAFRKRSGESRWWFIGVNLSASLVVLAAGVVAATRLLGPPESPRETRFLVLQAIGGLTLAILAAGTSGWAIDRLRRRRAMRALASTIGDTPAPGALNAVLSKILASKVEMAYWIPEAEVFVDAVGRVIQIAAGVTSIDLRRDGALIAVATIEGPLDDPRLVAEQVGSAARLAIDNERLRAHLEYRLGEVVASRGRITAAADQVRRSVERDLHDGAQSSLVAALAELGAADRVTDDRIRDIRDQAAQLLERLRGLSRGIYPAILDQLGLEDALLDLVDDLDHGADLTVTLSARPCAEVEAAAYLIVERALRNAVTLPSAIRVTGSPTPVVLDIDGDLKAVPTDLADRAHALGGTISRVDAGWRAVLPCVS